MPKQNNDDDKLMQIKFKIMLDKETKKCKEISDTSNIEKCKSLAIAFVVKKFLRKYGNNSFRLKKVIKNKIMRFRKK